MTEESDSNSSGVPSIVERWKRFTHRIFHVRPPQAPPLLHARTARTDIYNLSGEERVGLPRDWHKHRDNPKSRREDFAGTHAGPVNPGTARETVGRPKPDDEDDDGGSGSADFSRDRTAERSRTRQQARPGERARSAGKLPRQQDRTQQQDSPAPHEMGPDPARHQSRYPGSAGQERPTGRTRTNGPKANVAEEMLAEARQAIAERERAYREKLEGERKRALHYRSSPFEERREAYSADPILDRVDTAYLNRLARAPKDGSKDQEIEAQRNLDRTEFLREQSPPRNDYSRGRERGYDHGMSM